MKDYSDALSQIPWIPCLIFTKYVRNYHVCTSGQITDSKEGYPPWASASTSSATVRHRPLQTANRSLQTSTDRYRPLTDRYRTLQTAKHRQTPLTDREQTATDRFRPLKDRYRPLTDR
ncbi:mirror-image polydactyly 1 protein [Plakobranchus ocellatus]|uniref:Mirror-image polydactyly 1 protein n=1 Tax=Plakobranchus ocellatus TaxID=259542 RepID=A0AAV4BCM5_9GAST|nr:mirror-image polydactyly 1 protein [Plakobranchus ocellatus]